MVTFEADQSETSKFPYFDSRIPPPWVDDNSVRRVFGPDSPGTLRAALQGPATYEVPKAVVGKSIAEVPETAIVLLIHDPRLSPPDAALTLSGKWIHPYRQEEPHPRRQP